MYKELLKGLYDSASADTCMHSCANGEVSWIQISNIKPMDKVIFLRTIASQRIFEEDYYKRISYLDKFFD